MVLPHGQRLALVGSSHGIALSFLISSVIQASLSVLGPRCVDLLVVMSVLECPAIKASRSVRQNRPYGYHPTPISALKVRRVSYALKDDATCSIFVYSPTSAPLSHECWVVFGRRKLSPSPPLPPSIKESHSDHSHCQHRCS